MMKHRFNWPRVVENHGSVVPREDVHFGQTPDRDEELDVLHHFFLVAARVRQVFREHEGGHRLLLVVGEAHHDKVFIQQSIRPIGILS